jgi:hypothetical protein
VWEPILPTDWRFAEWQRRSNESRTAEYISSGIRSMTEGLEAGILAEQLLNNRLQKRVSSASKKVVTLTKQMKIGLCEQVRVN